MAKTRMETISVALKLIDAKKDELRKAFDDVQSNSLSLSSFTLAWPDLDSHFTSIQSSLNQRFHHLQTLTDQSVQHLDPVTVNAERNRQDGIESTSKPALKKPAAARPELKKFCKGMDGVGLRRYITERPNLHAVITGEIPDALTHAPDAAKLVLDAIEGVVHMKPGSGSTSSNKNKARNVSVSRKIDGVLLEALVGVVKRDEISGEVKERAKKLVAQWKGCIGKNSESSFVALGILCLLDSYGLVGECAAEELVDLIVQASMYRRATDFCRELGVLDKVPDIIQRLIETNKPSHAAKFIFEFKLTDKFPPVPILKAHIKNAKKESREILKNGNHSLQSKNEAVDKEVGALKSVLRLVKEHKLESEYPTEPIEKRIESAESKKRSAKRAAATFQQNQNNNKRAVTRTPVTSAPPLLHNNTFVNSTGQQPSHHPPTAGMVLDQRNLYLIPSASSHRLGADPYLCLSGGPGLLGTPSTSSLIYSSEPNVQQPAAYHNAPSAYVGYNLPPEYTPGFYPPR